MGDERYFVADATVYIEAASQDKAQDAMMDWVADTMPKNFNISWTLTEGSPEVDDG